jgi:hypothetical protein
MRERIEDLGRLAILLDDVLDHSVWEVYVGRKKDFIDHLRTLSEDKQYDLLHNLIYGMGAVRERLESLRAIAYGIDSLNDPIKE